MVFTLDLRSVVRICLSVGLIIVLIVGVKSMCGFSDFGITSIRVSFFGNSSVKRRVDKTSVRLS